MTIGQRIKQRREELGMSQDELAKKVGYKSRSSINKIELSHRLSLNKVDDIAKALNCSPSYLMGWTPEIETISEESRDYYKSQVEKLLDKDKYFRNYLDTYFSIESSKKEEFIRRISAYYKAFGDLYKEKNDV